MSATVRIRVKYEPSESVGTGTIIDLVDDEALVLTCGHLFRDGEEQHPVSIELFQDGKMVQIPARVLDFRTDKIDLGLVAFRTSVPLTKVKILPKGEQLHERDSVFSIGCNGGEEPTRKETTISKLNRYLGPSNIEIAGAPVQGRSGGGLFDARGRLIGVCVAADNELDEGLFMAPDVIYDQLIAHRLNHLFE